MLEMRAIVVGVKGDEAFVRVSGGGCGNCSCEGGCGSHALSKLFCSSGPRVFNVRNDACAIVDDEVQVMLPDGVLLRGAVKLYALPLLLLLIGGVLGSSLANETVMRDVYAAAGAVAGLVLGFVWAKYSSSQVGHAVASKVLVSRSGM